MQQENLFVFDKYEKDTGHYYRTWRIFSYSIVAVHLITPLGSPTLLLMLLLFSYIQWQDPDPIWRAFQNHKSLFQSEWMLYHSRKRVPYLLQHSKLLPYYRIEIQVSEKQE